MYKKQIKNNYEYPIPIDLMLKVEIKKKKNLSLWDQYIIQQNENWKNRYEGWFLK
jgi:hypothetical protein